MMRRIVPFAVPLLAGLFMLAQDPHKNVQPTTQPDKPETPEAKVYEANPDDVASIDAIVDAFYALESGPPKQKRDWDRYRALFIPEARLVVLRALPNQKPSAVYISLDDYMKIEAAYSESRGFFGRDVNRITEHYRNMAHVLSTYEFRTGSPDAPVDYRGLASIQLFHDGERWWIVNVVWNRENPHEPIPAKYLPADADGEG